MVKSSRHLVLMSVRLVSHNPFFSILLFCFSNFFISIPLFQEEIFASSFAAAAYLKSIDFPKDKKVFFFYEFLRMRFCYNWVVTVVRIMRCSG
jgi:hypothetical protein